MKSHAGKVTLVKKDTCKTGKVAMKDLKYWLCLITTNLRDGVLLW